MPSPSPPPQLEATVKDLWIAGGSGAALEVWAVLRALEEAGRAPGTFKGFLLIEPPEFDPLGHALESEADFLATADPATNLVALGIGAPRTRQRAASNFQARGFALATLVHPTAVVGPQVLLGEGSVVMAQAVLETHARLGGLALINVHSSIAHGCVLGEACSLGPGAHLAGQVTLGDRCDLGVGAVVRPKVTLGCDIVVGAGAAVVRDHGDSGVLVGVPARPLVRP